MGMTVYSIISVTNAYESNSGSDYGAVGTWYQVFPNKEEAVELLKSWGCEQQKDGTFFKQTESSGKLYNFYYKINSHYLGAGR